MTGKSATLLVTFSILAAMIGIVSFSVPLYNFFVRLQVMEEQHNIHQLFQKKY